MRGGEGGGAGVVCVHMPEDISHLTERGLKAHTPHLGTCTYVCESWLGARVYIHAHVDGMCVYTCF